MTAVHETVRYVGNLAMHKPVFIFSASFADGAGNKHTSDQFSMLCSRIVVGDHHILVEMYDTEDGAAFLELKHVPLYSFLRIEIFGLKGELEKVKSYWVNAPRILSYRSQTFEVYDWDMLPGETKPKMVSAMFERVYGAG